MDVNRAQGIAALANNGGGGKGQYQNGQDSRANGGDTHGYDHGEAIDLGGLAGEITPAVQDLLDRLASEIEPLRAELRLVREHEQQMREEMARHTFLPVPGRREFMRHLNHVLNHIKDLTVPPSLGLLHIRSADEIRRRYGRGALDRALIDAANRIDERLGPNDVLGNLGGNDFAVILLGVEPVDARARMARIAGELGRSGPAGATPVDVLVGVAGVQPGMSAEAAIQAADKDLMR